MQQAEAGSEVFISLRRSRDHVYRDLRHKDYDIFVGVFCLYDTAFSPGNNCVLLFVLFLLASVACSRCHTVASFKV